VILRCVDCSVAAVWTIQRVEASCGPLRLFIERKSTRQFVAVIYDTRSRRNVYRRSTEGTLDDAMHMAVKAANAHLGSTDAVRS